MHSFQYYISTEVVFGTDSLAQLPALIKKHGGSRVLIVYGGGSAVRSGLISRVEALLTDAGVTFDTLVGVQPNPRVALAREGVRKAVALGADLILAVGPNAEGIFRGADALRPGRCFYFETPEALHAALPSLLRDDDTILVKASRGMHLEHTVALLETL